MIPTIDAFRCDGCGVCIQRCPPQIMGLVRGKAALLTDLCEECGTCNEVCPNGAVRFRLPHRTFAPQHDGYKPVPR